MKIRDLTIRQFLNALERRGMTLQGFTGYVGIGPAPNQHCCCVSYYNARSTWRARLAYLVCEQEKAAARHQSQAVAE